MGTSSGGSGQAPGTIRFERLRPSDLPLMHRWLNEPHVKRWWYDEGSSYEEIEKNFMPRISGEDPTFPYLILHDDTPIGYIQSYRISDHPDYQAQVQVERAAGLDLFIGEERLLYKNLGCRIIRQFLEEISFADESVESCVIGPEPDNAAAIRAYEKAGFRYLKTIHVPGEPEPEYLLQLSRAKFERNRGG